jgi:multidrug efflux pump subunit AcrB
MIRTPKGVSIPFSQVAKVKFSRNYSQINRVNRKRVITVSAEVDSSKGNANAINKQLKKILKEKFATKYRGFTYKVAGAQEEMGKTIPSMISGYIIALFMIYMLLAIPFKSYSQPFIVMTAIPFGFVGAVWAHLLLGWTMTIMSMVGLVALSGIVVNDSLVLVDYANQQIRSGKTAYEGFLIAVKNRFRPIMLTTLTTFFGLMPMIFEKSIQAKIIIPMAITLGFGVLFATTITLFLIPSLGLILEDLKTKKSGGDK